MHQHSSLGGLRFSHCAAIITQGATKQITSTAALADCVHYSFHDSPLYVKKAFLASNQLSLPSSFRTENTTFACDDHPGRLLGLTTSADGGVGG